jgi:hypothetical protein
MALFAANFFNQIINLVQNINNIGPQNTDRGNVISFHYQFYDHDPFPVIITTGFMSYNRIGGLNLHYLPFPVFQMLLRNWAGNPGFGYDIVKNQPLIKKSFRSYRLYGIRNAKKVNWKAVLQAMAIIRQYSPQEIRMIQNVVNSKVLSRQPEILNEILGGQIQNIQQEIENL